MHEYLFETEEHAALRRSARAFAERHVRPHARAFEEAGEFPRALYTQAAEAGLLGIGFDEALGGSGGDLGFALAAAEELVLAGHSVGTLASLFSHAIALPPLVRFGSDEQKRELVRPTLAGEKIAALAITEPSGGSDVANVQTRAVRDGDHFVVSGAKTFITSGTRADFVVAAVRTGGAGFGGVSLLVIESDCPGFLVSKKLDKMGWWASDTAELTFDGCRVPARNLVGAENAGFAMIAANFEAERLYLAGQCVALAQLAYDESVQYARDRAAFGKSLMAFQVTRHKLADARSRLAAARALVHETTVRVLRGEFAAGRCAMTKNVATDMATFVTDMAVQIHGGMGYMREGVVERLYRDARLYPIGGGTREIMNEIIAKTEGY